MRTVGVLVLAMGCSITGMTPLPSDYDERTIPRCNTHAVLAVGDAAAGLLFGALAIAGAVVGEDADQAESDERTKLVLAMTGGTLVFAISAFVGFKWDSSCTEAKKQWDVRQIEQDTLVQESKRDRMIEEAEARERAMREREAQPKEPPPDEPTPRGFFCATSVTSPAAALCARQKPDCARSRDAAVVAVADLTECTLVETAWCVQVAADDDRCFPAEDVCGAAVVRLGTTAECREMK